MSNVILGLLFVVGPQTIYSLNKFFEAGISLFYAASLGALRQALQRLLADGHVAVDEQHDGGRVKKVYSITSAGRDAFLAWMRGPLTERDAEVGALSKLYFLGALGAPDRQATLETIRQRIARDEAALQAIVPLVDGAEVPEEFRRIAHYQRLTLEYGLRSHAFAREFFAALDTDDAATP